MRGYYVAAGVILAVAALVAAFALVRAVLIGLGVVGPGWLA